MKAVKLSGSVRTGVGKRLASAIRTSGFVPGVIYGGDTQIPIKIKEVDLNKMVFTPNVYQYILNIDGTEYKAIMKEIQQHPVTDRVIHVDFMELTPNKIVKLRVPIKLEGNAIGVKNGGTLISPNRAITIQGMPDNFPDVIKVDITKLKIGQSIKVGDLTNDNLKILASDDMLLASIKMSRGAIVDDEEGEEGAAEGGDTPAEGGDAPAEEKKD